ncbi:MAG: hypothetical protein HY286_02945 [Planctomycetes bacterium]|nr:hypothetical protein [Planctomycetota bacterium]
MSISAKPNESTVRRLAQAGALLSLALIPVSMVFAQGGGPDAFWTKFIAEVEVGDPQVLVSLVRKFPTDATWALARRAQVYGVNNNAKEAESIEKLIQTWKDAYKNNFLDKYYDDLRNLDQGQWNEWNRTLGRYNALLASDQKRRAKELDDEKLDKFGADAAEVAGVFETLGDKYLAGDCYYWAGSAFDPDSRAKGYDLQKSVEYYEKTIRLREKLDDKDSFYTDLSTLLEKNKALLKKGGPPKQPDPKEKDKKPAGGSPTPGGGEVFAKGSAWVPANAKFQAAPPEDIERPGWNTDSNYIDWLPQTIEGKPSPTCSAAVQFFTASKDAKFIREADSKYLFDPGDKIPVPLKLGRPMTFEFKIPNGGVEYAMTAAIGSNQEAYHGTVINYSSNETRAQILYTSAASRLVELAGQKLRIFDDNCDGKFGSDPSVIGTKTLEGIPYMDSILFPGGKRAMPWSGFVKLGAKWYRLKGDSEQLGAKFQVRELDIKTGTIKANWSGPAAFKPHYLVVTETSEFTGAYFDLLSNDKGVEVPAGEYQFVYGMFRVGKGRNFQKYAIINGDPNKRVKVAAGQTVTVEFGAPFSFAAKSQLDGNEISVTGKSIEIQGQFGERYVRLSDETPHPKLEWRKPGAKGGTVAGEMKRVELKSGQDPVDLLWPNDLKVKRPDPGTIEYRLIEEHKWLGPIASKEWIKS